jgi:hypothetical protein
VDASNTARRNNSQKAIFTQHAMDNPFASGAFRWVAKGKYISGSRTGQDCVCKWFKTGGVMESHFFDTDLATVNEAIRLISKWNEKNLVNRMIQVNLPEVWTMTTLLPGSRSQWAGKKVLQEPFIQGYQKFNSNTGWADNSVPWSRVMQALSHFSYHISNGQRLLCDLQGGVNSDGVVLTDPVVISTTRQYGPTDLGSKGISNFFAYHVCNEFCRAEWRKPTDRLVYFQRTSGTSMLNHQQHVPVSISESLAPNIDQLAKDICDNILKRLQELEIKR